MHFVQFSTQSSKGDPRPEVRLQNNHRKDLKNVQNELARVHAMHSPQYWRGEAGSAQNLVLEEFLVARSQKG